LVSTVNTKLRGGADVDDRGDPGGSGDALASIERSASWLAMDARY
jgi:hypothetical protein